MKNKIVAFLLAGFCCSVLSAQEIQDAIRFSQDNLNGTARFRAMSGAFGALGGDLSSININPAGSAVFTNNQLGLTMSNHSLRNQARYFGSSATERENSFDLNQLGAVFVFNSYDDSPWRKVTFAINYENSNNFDNSVFTAGTNPTNSVDRYFLHYAQGVPLDLLSLQNNETITDLYFYLAGLPDMNYPNINGYRAQQAFLGYQGYIINPVSEDLSNTNYVSNVPQGGNYYQENFIVSSGFNGKLTFNLAAQYEDWLYLGMNLNSHFTDYRKTSSFYEDNVNNPTSGIQQIRFNNDLRTFGNGFSFDLGAIAKFDELRVGIAYESPTWYRFTDQLSQYVVTNCANCGQGVPSTIVVDPRVINEYPSYRLRTPGKWTGSLAYVFGTSGLLSVDFGVKDYSNTEFRPSSGFFRPINNEMADIFTLASEVRLGGEYRVKAWSFRGGYRFEQSPYKDGRTMGDLMGYSAGIGYNFGSTRLDLAYSFFQREYDQQMFSAGLTDAARIKASDNTVTLTLLFEL